jgi:hypothetical protein
MVVPAYCCSSEGRVFRVLRLSQQVAPGRMRFVLRAQPINFDGAGQCVEFTREVDAELIRDKIMHRQAIPTPETTYEDLWHQLRLAIDARDAPSGA